MLVAGGIALGATEAFGAAGPRAAAVPAAKRAAIKAVALPAGFNGLIAYGRQGKVEHVRCVGLADIEAGRPFTEATQIRWGSVTKWLVSVAVLRLVEAKRLSLDAPIGTYLPDLPPETGGQVRLRHLLSNTSGIPDLLGRQVKVEPELRRSTVSAAAMAARFAGGDLAFVPGQGWDYAALNWVLVAAIVEQVTGEKLAAVVGRLVFGPLGMTSAGFVQSDQPPLPALAAAYTATLPPVRKMGPVPPALAGSGNAAGGVRDAMRAAHGIFHGSLLRPASRAALTTIAWPDEEYALGGRVRSIDGEPWGWETGKVEGYRTHIAHCLSRSETIVVFDTTDMVQSTIGGWVTAIARA